MANAPDLNQLIDSTGAIPQSTVGQLMNETKMQLVSQFPYLANDPAFNQQLNDAFANFVSQGTQSGTDYNDVYSKTIAPFASKWQAQATQATARTQEGQELSALQIAKETGSPTAAVQAFPQLIAPTSKFRAEWVGRINKADESPSRMSPQSAAILAGKKDAYAEALKSGDTQSSDALEKEIENFKPSLNRPTSDLAATPSTVAPGSGVVSSPGPGVAAPQGTSGYVNYSVPPSLRPQGRSYIGAALSPSAEAAMFGGGNNPAAQQAGISLTPPDTSSIAPVGAASPASAPPVTATPARSITPTLQNSGILGLAASRAKAALSPGPFLHRNPTTLRAYVAAHPELSADTKEQLLREAKSDEGAPNITLSDLTGNLRTTGKLAKDFLFGQSEAPLPVPAKKPATVQLIQNALQQTNGDKDAARKLLTDSGYMIPAAQ